MTRGTFAEINMFVLAIWEYIKSSVYRIQTPTWLHLLKVIPSRADSPDRQIQHPEYQLQCRSGFSHFTWHGYNVHQIVDQLIKNTLRSFHTPSPDP